MSPKKYDLNLVYVSDSGIHGKGLFARKSILKGAYIGYYEGPIARRNGSHVLWVTYPDGREVGRSGRNKLRFLNHSNRPNCEFDGFECYALKNIKADQELTFNYGSDPATWDDE